jgi:hypothetical protein
VTDSVFHRIQIATESAQQVPDAVAASNATVLASRLTVDGPFLRFAYKYRDIPKGARLAEIAYMLPRGTTDWIQPSALTKFLANNLQPSGSAFLTLADRSCATPGEYRVDLYSGARRLATATASSPLRTEKLTSYVNVADGIELCRPPGWPLSAGATVALTSPGKERHISIQVAPLTRPDLRGARPSVIKAVLDRMIRQLSPNPHVLAKGSRSFGGLAGTFRRLRLPGNRTGFAWASIGADGILRTLEATYPVGKPGALNDVALYLQFQL